MNVIAYAIYTCSSNTTPRDIYCIHYNILVRINPEFLDDQSYAGISEIIILHGGTVALQAYCSLNLFIAKIAANIFYSKYICMVESHSRHCVFTYVSLKISHVRIDASVLYARAYMSVSSRLVSSRFVSAFGRIQHVRLSWSRNTGRQLAQKKDTTDGRCASA